MASTLPWLFLNGMVLMMTGMAGAGRRVLAGMIHHPLHFRASSAEETHQQDPRKDQKTEY